MSHQSKYSLWQACPQIASGYEEHCFEYQYMAVHGSTRELATMPHLISERLLTTDREQNR